MSKKWVIICLSILAMLALAPVAGFADDGTESEPSPLFGNPADWARDGEGLPLPEVSIPGDVIDASTDNASLSQISIGITNELQDVWGTSPTDVFAVGNGGTILHYNGTSWSQMASGTTKDLYGVWGSSSSNVFAVGISGTILLYDGTIWNVGYTGSTSPLRGVWGSSATDIFACGGSGEIWHYDGSSWNQMDTPVTLNIYKVQGTSSSNVFAVCEDRSILHYDGNAWNRIGFSSSNIFYGLWVSPSNDVFICGSERTIFRYSGGAWTTMTTTPNSHTLTDMWGVSSTDIIAVGMTGTMLHYNGTTWQSIQSGTTQSLDGVWGTSSTDVFVVGAQGTIIHHQGGWNPPTHKLVLSVVGNGTTIPSAGEYDYNEGDTINISATPATGCRFVNWTGDTSTIANTTSASTQITMNDDYNITANFVENDGQLVFPESLFTQLLVVMSSRYDSVSSLHSPKIRLSNSGYQDWLQTALSTYGISFTSIVVPSTDVLAALQTNVIDAALVSIHPYSPLESAINSGELKLLPWSDTAINAVVQAYSTAITPTLLPANTYSGQIQTISGYAPISPLVVLSASSDTFVVSGYPNDNFNGYYLTADSYQFYMVLVGDYTSTGHQRELVKFSLPSFLSGTTINQATLDQYMCMYWTPGPTIPITSYRVTSNWTSSSVTWNTKPTYNGTSISSVSIGTDFGACYWDVTSLVQNWVNGTYTNYGIMLKGPETGSQDMKGFYSIEAGVNGPVLEVQFTPPPVMTSVFPYDGNPGQNLAVAINGAYLMDATAVNFGNGITVNSFTVNNAITITANITISIGANPGLRNVSVTTPRGQVTLSNIFTVLQPVPDISVAPTSFNFGSAAINSVSSPQVITINSVGNGILYVTGISLSDTNNFSLDVNGGSSPAHSTTPVIPAGSNCTVTVTFMPKSAGTFNANLTINSDDPDTPSVTVSLTGAGVAPPQISFTPADNTTITASQTVTFIAHLDSGSPVADEDWKWDFDYHDSDTDIDATGMTPPAQNWDNVANTYVVRLTATNAAGTDVETRVITVTPGPLSKIMVSPNTAFVQPAATQQFSAMACDEYSNTISGLTYTWSVVNGGGSIDGSGLFTAGGTTGTFSNTIQAEDSYGGATKQGTATVAVGAIMTITATLQGENRTQGGMNVPLTLKLYDQAVTTGNIYDANPANMLNPVATFRTLDKNIAITDTNANTKVITFTVGALPTGTYNITLHTPQALVNLRNAVTIPAPGTIDMGMLLEGDARDIAEGSKTIDVDDFTRFAAAYESEPKSPNWDYRADFDRNNQITILDFSSFYTNYGKVSPQTIE